MFPPSHRALRFSGVVVAVVLLGLTAYPGTLATPYVTAQETPRYTHTIAPESSEAYERYTEDHDLDVYRYDELSPTGQELVDRTREGRTAGAVWGRQYVPDVCREFMLVCDEYARDELPEKFTYGTELSPEESRVIIEDGDDRYLLQTGITGHLFLAPFPVRFVLAWLTMPPLAALVALVTVDARSARALGGAVGGGALVAVLGVLAPYAEMAGLVSARAVGALVLGGVWVGILAAGGHRLYRWMADGGRRGSSTRDV